MKYKYKLILALSLIWGFVAFLYYPVLNAQYVWDDTLLFVTKTGLREGQLSWELISSPVLPGTSYFRPFIFLTWYWEFNFFGQNPVISHLIGLIIFAINASLVFGLGLVLSRRFNIKNNAVLLSLLASFIYISHPSLIESTAWVSGRFDQFCTLFVLSALIVFLKKFTASDQAMSLGAVICVSAFYLLGLLSKELGLMLPFILLVFYFCLERNTSYWDLVKNAFKYQKTLIVFIGMTTLIYFLLRISAISQIYHVTADKSYYYDLVYLQILPLHAIKYYLAQIFLPFSNIDLISPLNEINTTYSARIAAYLSGIFVLCLIGFSLIKRSLFSALFLSSFVSLFLVLYIIPLGLSSNLGHSRFLTLPLVFISLAVVFLPYDQFFDRLSIKSNVKKIIYTTVIVAWILLSALTVKSVIPFWMNEYTLWSWAYKNHPNSALARYNYLYSATLYQKFDQVIELADKYVKEKGQLEVADQAVYANALLNKGDEDSLNYYEGVISVLPKFHERDTPEAKRQVNSFNLTSAQIGDTYSSYAIGLILMRNELAFALKNLKNADWYMMPDQKSNVNYYSVIALYLSNDEKEALRIYNHQKQRDLRIGVENYKIVSALIGTYCDKYEAENTQCSAFLKNNPFK